jgi:lipid A disaccharide synthetase
LVSALKAQNSDIQIEGMAGERMFEAGCVQLWDKNLAKVSAALMAIFIKVLFAWKDNLWLFVKGTINHHYITNYLY